MPTIAYTIDLEQPVLATSLLGDPNSTVSYDAIPGSTLRGLFAQRFRDGAGGNDDAHFRRLFLSGKVRFLNAYPVDSDGVRCLPTPRALHQKKGQRDNPFHVRNRATDHSELTERWKPLKPPFCSWQRSFVTLYTPLQTIAVHVQRDRLKGRAWLERRARGDRTEEIARGTVFRYEALAPGQRLLAYLLIDEDITQIDQDLLRGLLAPEAAWLGRSRSAGYGRVRLAEAPVPTDWREAPAGAPVDGLWTMTLLSPTLLRGADPARPELLGEDVQHLDDATLSAYLGCQVQIVPEGSFTAGELVGGFNRHWGLPLPQRHALAMGSVIAFKAINNTLNTAAIELSGIGDRRAEGFGRVAFNWLMEQSYQGCTVDLSTPASVQPAQDATAAAAQPAQDLPASPLTGGLRQLAARTADRLLDARIDVAIVAFVQSQVWPQVRPGDDADGRSRDRMPSNSQLARLNTLVRQAAATGDTDAVLREFNTFRATARTTLEQARLANGEPLASWVRDLLEQPAQVWDLLGRLPEIKVGEVAPTRDLPRSRVVALRLLAAVLAAPARQRKSAEFQPQEGRP